MKSGRLTYGGGIVEEEAEQYRHDMLAEIASLPSQDEIELTDEMLDTRLWEGLDQVSAHSSYEITKAGFQPILRDYLRNISGSDRNFYVGVPAMEMFNYVCLTFRFRPKINKGLERFMQQKAWSYEDRGLDVSNINQLVDEHFLKKIDYEGIGLQKATIEKFRQAGIVTVGDFILNASTNHMHKFHKMSPTTLQRVAEHIEKEFGINRRDIKAHPILRESVFTRYAVLKSTQSTTE